MLSPHDLHLALTRLERQVLDILAEIRRLLADNMHSMGVAGPSHAPDQPPQTIPSQPSASEGIQSPPFLPPSSPIAISSSSEDESPPNSPDY